MKPSHPSFRGLDQARHRAIFVDEHDLDAVGDFLGELAKSLGGIPQEKGPRHDGEIISRPCTRRFWFSWAVVASARIARVVGYAQSMKIAVPIPDPVFESAERLASERKKSRSQLYSEAVAEYVAWHDSATLTDRINAVCDEVETSDSFVSAAARRILSDTEW